MTEKFLDIQPEVINDLIDKLDSEEEEQNFIEGILEEMEDEQPSLYGQFERNLSSADCSLYPEWIPLSSAFTYKMLPERIKREQLTQDHIDTFRRSLLEKRTSFDAENNSARVNVSWALDKLHADSPLYVAWLTDNADRVYKEVGLKASSTFISGGVITAMPFYMREEAKHLSRLFAPNK